MVKLMRLDNSQNDNRQKSDRRGAPQANHNVQCSAYFHHASPATEREDKMTGENANLTPPQTTTRRLIEWIANPNGAVHPWIHCPMMNGEKVGLIICSTIGCPHYGGTLFLKDDHTPSAIECSWPNLWHEEFHAREER